MQSRQNKISVRLPQATTPTLSTWHYTVSGGSKKNQRGRSPGRLPDSVVPPHPINALSGSAQLELWNCCTCLLALQFAQALKIVIEELINGKSGILTDIFSRPKLTHFRPLKYYLTYFIFTKINKIVASGCQILRLKCIKFHFGWGSASDPCTGELTALTALAGGRGSRLHSIVRQKVTQCAKFYFNNHKTDEIMLL